MYEYLEPSRLQSSSAHPPSSEISNAMDAESRGLVSSLETLSIGSTIGSRCNGMLLCHIDCAAYAAGMQGNSCQQIGAQSCSSCKLVKYCSRACQTAHWPTHKASCKSPYMSASWTTAWDREKRSPAFMTETDLPYSGFGRSLYVWGNLPAIDCMNVAKNEGDAVSGMDLNLAFVASGDLRNMMTTVNGLPSNYNGKCKILLNDLNSTVAGRNTAILFILLSDSELEVEEAAELCLHLQYSAALTRAQATYVFERLAVLFKDGEIDGCFKSIPLRGGGRLYLSLAEISDIVSMVASSYSLRKAIQSMHSVMLAPSRKDFVDRYLFALRGPHRVGEMHLRRTGVLLPFNAPTDHFTEPNRLLFDKSGGWLNPDSASQLSGWDPRQVVETGKQYGCSPDDISGCLFFHVKHVYLDFAKRVEQFKVDIHITSGNAVVLPELLEEHVGYLRHFSPPTFDRIETSNVMDYVDIGQLVGGWSRLLNRANKHSTLLLSTMNWLLWRPDAQAHSLARKGNAIKPVMLRCASYLDLDPHRLTMRSSDSDPKFLTLFQHLDNFHDNSASFRDYLTERIDLSGIAKRNRLALRTMNTVTPRGVGWPLSSQPKIMPPYPKEDWYLLSCLGRVHGHERFLELSVA